MGREIKKPSHSLLSSLWPDENWMAAKVLRSPYTNTHQHFQANCKHNISRNFWPWLWRLCKLHNIKKYKKIDCLVFRFLFDVMLISGWCPWFCAAVGYFKASVLIMWIFCVFIVDALSMDEMLALKPGFHVIYFSIWAFTIAQTTFQVIGAIIWKPMNF